MHENNIILPPSSYLRGEGCGNTFLIFDHLNSSSKVIDVVIEEAYASLIKEKCDDALILKEEFINEKKLVLTMIVLEPDGSIAEFCGNGARVIGCYLRYKFGDLKRAYYLKTSQGIRKIWWDEDRYYVEMGSTDLLLNHNKFVKPELKTFCLGLGMRQFTFFWTETLEPHLVTFDPIEETELNDLGSYLNRHQRSFFPLGINLNKAEVTSKNSLNVTTFERGVNRITQACGTGATSCAMLARFMGRLSNECSIQVSLKGGVIFIKPEGEASVMSGPATIDV